MTKKIVYRVIPHDRWMIVRFHSDENGAGSEQRGEFMNEREAEEVAGLLAKAEDGAVFISRASMNRKPVGVQIGGEKGRIA
jgi:hypothetical protein